MTNRYSRFKIYFVLSGDENDTDVRRLETNDQTINKDLFHTGNIDAFILSTSKFVLFNQILGWSHYSFSLERPLDRLNYLHIWHDNRGEGRSASWFLKCFVVKDLQTEEISYFIAQRWFAVEKDDGKVILIFSFLFSSSNIK